MERARITLARLMVFVGIIALEMAGFRAFLYRGDELALGLAVTGLACQFGLLCAVRGSGPARAFWAGFVAMGLVMMATFAWGICFPESQMNDLWASYRDCAEGVLSSIPNTPRWLYQDVGQAVVWALPQLLAALIGGLLAALAMPRRVRHADESRFGSASS